MQYFDKSAVAQHALENNHHIVFDEARLIDRATNYWDRIRREAIEIKLRPNNFNRDSGLYISKAWDPDFSFKNFGKKNCVGYLSKYGN